ncbi:M28 family peptidase [Paenibacillus sp. NPDC058071]|uniref:M28 family peptidase n=1 Tax=Paenibacillus sp. NPDC058071 TaxID=3346326 RepID=UPI0036D9CD78
MSIGNQSSHVEQIIEQADAAELWRHAAELAQYVRTSGSEEELRAFQYVKEQLESFGLKTRLSFHKAWISIPGKAELIVGGRAYPVITHAMSPALARTELSLAVYEPSADPTKQSLAGKAVLVNGLAAWPIIERMERQGASAVIFMNRSRYTHEMITSGVWGNPSTSDRLYPSIPAFSVNETDGASLLSELHQFPEAVASLYGEVQSEWRDIPLLTAELTGAVEPEKFVLFSGHIDAWHYGAMDNGAANAVMLESARVLARNNGQLRRTIRWAFWSGHSHGRYAGSALYADAHWEELQEHGVLHINIDSVGAKGAVQLGAANVMAETKQLSKQAIELGAGRRFGDHDFHGSPFGRAGDQSFWGTGLPSAFMGLSYQEDGWFGWWWHTTEDTLDKLDEQLLLRDCKVYIAALHDAANAAVIPIDQRAAATLLAERLLEYETLAGERLSVQSLLAKANRLKLEIEHFYARHVQLASANRELRQVNRVIIQLSRILVPALYIKGSLYEHDPAVQQPLVPALSEIEELAAAEAGSDRFYRLQTGLLRKQNQLADLLNKGLLLLSTFVSEEGERNDTESI